MALKVVTMIRPGAPAFLLMLALAGVPVSAQSFSEAIGAQEAYRLAVDASRELSHEAHALKLKRASWWLGIREFFPRLGMDVGQDERLSAFGPDTYTLSFGLRLDQLLWDGGKLVSRRRIEKVAMEAASLGLDLKGAALGEAAVEGYWNVLALRERLAIRRNSLEASRQELKRIVVEEGLGLRTRDEAAEAELTLLALEIEEKEASIGLREAEEELAFLLGLESLPMLAGRIDPYAKAFAIDGDAFIAAALSGSRELKLAELSLEQSRIAVRASWSAWMPTLSLSASASARGKSLPLTGWSWNVGLNIVFSSPIAGASLGGSYGQDGPHEETARLSARAEPLTNPAGIVETLSPAAEYRYEISRYEDSVESFGRSVRFLLCRYVFLVEKRELAAAALALSRRKKELVGIRVELGKARSMELVEAEIERSRRELELIDAAAAILKVARELERLAALPSGGLSSFQPSAKVVPGNGGS